MFYKIYVIVSVEFVLSVDTSFVDYKYYLFLGHSWKQDYDLNGTTRLNKV